MTYVTYGIRDITHHEASAGMLHFARRCWGGSLSRTSIFEGSCEAHKAPWLMGPGTGGTVWICRIFSFQYFSIFVILFFECHFDAIWKKGFCDSCLHRFGSGFSLRRWTWCFPAMDLAGLWWMDGVTPSGGELHDGNCNQSWASRSESSSQVGSNWVWSVLSTFYTVLMKVRSCFRRGRVGNEIH